MGAELNRLGRHGWRVLHSIRLANKVDIDHLPIGVIRPRRTEA